MLFNSFEYLLFLPIVFAVYWAIGYARINDSLKLRLQNAFVVIASYVFYGWWDWRFMLLIAFTSLCSYASGILIAKSEEVRVKSQKPWKRVQYLEEWGLRVYTHDYFSPITSTRVMRKTKNTYSIHYFAESWRDGKRKRGWRDWTFTREIVNALVQLKRKIRRQS